MTGARPDSRRRLPSEVWIAALALALTAAFVNTLPGLNGDEAWVLLRVREIAGGDRPTGGMSSYTGVLHAYLLWPLCRLFGYRVVVLRLFSATCNVAALMFLMRTIRRLYGGQQAIIAGLLVATAPAFVCFARFGVEITALTFLFAALGSWLVVRALASPGRQAPLAVAAGLAFGLGAYNHVLAVTMPFAIGVGCLVVYRGAFVRHPVTRWATLGVALGLVPRALQALAGVPGVERGFLVAGLRSSWRDLPAVPRVLAGVLDGDLVYQRFVGGRVVPVLPYLVAALVVLAFLRLRPGTPRVAPRERALLVALGVLLLATVAITPRLSLRYFLLPALGGIVLLARLQRGRVVALVAAANLTYLGVDYFFAFARSGGALSHFSLGSRLVETSDHFVRTDRLWRELRARGVEAVLGDNFIVWPLEVEARAEGAPVELYLGPPVAALPADARHLKKRTAVVFYAGPTFIHGGLEDPPATDELLAGEVRFRRQAGFDPHFLVYIAEPG